MRHHHHRHHPGHMTRHYRPYRAPYGMYYGRGWGWGPRRPLGWGFGWMFFPLFFMFMWSGSFWLLPLGLILLFVLLPMLTGNPNPSDSVMPDEKEKGKPTYDDDYDAPYDEEYFQTVDGQTMRVVEDDGSQTRLTLG